MNIFAQKRNKSTTSSVFKAMNQKQQRYETLVNVYSPDLYRYAHWICRDPDISKDLVQETCLRAWKNLDSLADDKAVKGWLFTILRRENARRFERKQLPLVDIDDHGIEDDYDASMEMDNELLRRKILALPVEYKVREALHVVRSIQQEKHHTITDTNVAAYPVRIIR